MLYELIAKSSSNDGCYNITIYKKGSGIRISCNCMAGSVGAGVMCKHVVAIITGEFGKIIDTSDPKNEKAFDAHDFINKSGIKDKYTSLASELDLLKKSFKLNEKEIKSKINGLLRASLNN
ncbi:hypothetical protein CUU54_02670 [Pectobacterium polaris]|uniref:hypothetical protein n=1 Tax=Pectobacterium polaris TaxID=2042057 RepID=UPI000D607B74|nr:hypothetical protein [Pectobacterium polaris]MCU1787761.1 hypothetical protein [Pectobacterium polaris]PWD57075.1 hypothetical protein DF209_15665 [Pectobacterium polaris]